MAVSFSVVRLLTNTANVTPVDFQNLFELRPHRNRSNQSRRGLDRGIACKDQEVLASSVIPNHSVWTHPIYIEPLDSAQVATIQTTIIGKKLGPWIITLTSVN
jgi:hypothetical protein